MTRAYRAFLVRAWLPGDWSERWACLKRRSDLDVLRYAVKADPSAHCRRAARERIADLDEMERMASDQARRSR